MNKSYIVLIRDEDEATNTTICSDTNELNLLLSHLDEERFTLIMVEPLQKFSSDIRFFCKSEDKLETGKEQK